MDCVIGGNANPLRRSKRERFATEVKKRHTIWLGYPAMNENIENIGVKNLPGSGMRENDAVVARYGKQIVARAISTCSRVNGV